MNKCERGGVAQVLIEIERAFRGSNGELFRGRARWGAVRRAGGDVNGREMQEAAAPRSLRAFRRPP